MSLLALELCVSCRTAPPLPAADFSAPGWRVMQGQAVWKPARDRAELAGDLLLATNSDGDVYVQLTKTPFPLASAEVAGDRWQIAFGAKDSQTVKAFEEAESYPGTSLIIAYSPCIEHGYELGGGLEQQKLAVDSGFWPLFRFDPRRLDAGEPGLKLDSAAPKIPLEKLWASERRFQLVSTKDPVRGKAVLAAAQAEVLNKFALYERMAAQPVAASSLIAAK